jgi:hypothetical protein
MHGGKERCTQFGGRPVGKNPFGRLGIDGRSMAWIDLAQDRDKWQALVKEWMNLWVPQSAENFLTS